MASDRLQLSSAQQKSIWNDIGRHAAKQNAPSNFNAAIGTAIPAGVSTYPLPRAGRARRAGGEAVSATPCCRTRC